MISEGKRLEIQNRVGEESINNQGYKMKLIKYNSYKDVDIEFEDGTIIYKKSYIRFKNGFISNPNFYKEKHYKEKNINWQNKEMEIIEYRTFDDVDIQFLETKYIRKNVTYDNFLKGHITDYLIPTVCKVGYIGIEKFSGISNTKSYITWNKMIQRCYMIKLNSYKDCTVCEEWHNYSNFKKWFDENYYECENERMHLDKDILIKGNKIYSPETCIFAPQRINALFIKLNKNNTGYKSVYKKSKNIFCSRLSKLNERIELGLYDTPEEAFEVYKKEKEKYIKEIADYYKIKYSNFPTKLYNAMYKYEVEIND